MVPCPSLSSPTNLLRGSGVSDRSPCGAVSILERFRRRGEGGGGERGEEGGGRRREGAGRREEEGGGQVERRPAVPGLAVAQLRRRDGGIRFGRGVVGGDGRRDGGVRLGRRV